MNKKLVSLMAATLALLGVFALLAPATAQILTGTAVGVSLGLALIVIGTVAAALIVNQVRFGLSADRLLKVLIEEGDDRGFPDLPRRPSGRVLPEVAQAYVEKCRSDVDSDPADWRLWFLLAGSFEIARDRHNAVLALRKANELNSSRVVGPHH